VALQAKILDNIWQQLAPGGTMLYATCSILAEENREQILSFLERTKDAVHISLSDQDSPENPGRQILPGESGMDGFYYAKLQKRS
jgi:16S rRNA (cytosine967-C5)-methyltransferase